MVKGGLQQSSGRVYTLNIVYKEVLRKRDRDRAEYNERMQLE
jgi:hypothetical protein